MGCAGKYLYEECRLDRGRSNLLVIIIIGEFNFMMFINKKKKKQTLFYHKDLNNKLRSIYEMLNILSHCMQNQNPFTIKMLFSPIAPSTYFRP